MCPSSNGPCPEPMFPSGGKERLVLLLVCGIPILGAFFVSSGLFTLDELIYLISVDAMATRGSLIVDNGSSQFASADLNLWFLIDGPNGVTPQYPPGLALLGAPFYLALGARGLILLNALAAAGIALLTFFLAKRLYGGAVIPVVSVLILTFCTFQLEYAWGIWPHMTSAFFVLLAFSHSLNAMESEQTAVVLRNAIGSGLAVGAGMLLRADAFLVLPIIATCVFLAARRPVLTMLGGAMGLVPGIVAGAWFNLYKFGSPNFLSYGRTGSGGGTDVTTYLGLCAVLAAAFLGLLFLRSLEWTRPRIRHGVIAGIAVLAVLTTLPQTRDILTTLGRGFMALFVDSRTIVDSREAVAFDDEGFLIFWGIAKKALFQSMPWLAVLAALLLSPWRRELWKPNGLLLVFLVIWSLPFVALSWHGGLGSNMRYFMPALPIFAILSSALIAELANGVTKPGHLAASGIVGGVVLGVVLYDGGDRFPDGFTQQALTLYVFIGTLVIVAAASLLNRTVPALRAPAFLAVSFSLGIGVFASALVDVTYAQRLRTTTAAVSDLTEGLPGPVLIYGAPKLFAFAVRRPDVILGMAEMNAEKIDYDLFVDAIGSGYRAVAPLDTAEQVSEVTNLTFVGLDISPDGQWVEIVAAPPAD